MRRALLMSCFLAAAAVWAADIDELKLKMEERSRQIAELEKEIAQYKSDIASTKREAQTLNSEIKFLSSVIAKLQADIKITERRIDFSNLTIEKLSTDIAETKSGIAVSTRFLADLLRELDEISSQSLVEVLLANLSISGFFDRIAQVEAVQDSARSELKNLREQKIELEEELKAREAEKERFLNLKRELGDRRAIESEAKNEKSSLLNITKNKESEYQAMLNDRLRKKEALEAEIRAIEEEIRVTIDPSLLPKPASGILAPPLSKISLLSCWDGGKGIENCVTQFFGQTDFATANPQVYSGRGHNGIDFRADVGSEVFSSYDGKVRAVGNTDDQCRGVSYGRWILIDHPNNISTLYSHLSRITAVPGQTVSRGERIGYTGQTGYATGPHLHFAVFAAQAVQLTSLTPGSQYYYKSRICGTPLYMPISPPQGYLNPLSYL